MTNTKPACSQCHASAVFYIEYTEGNVTSRDPYCGNHAVLAIRSGAYSGMAYAITDVTPPEQNYVTVECHLGAEDKLVHGRDEDTGRCACGAFSQWASFDPARADRARELVRLIGPFRMAVIY